jgi:hypothetical protein
VGAVNTITALNNAKQSIGKNTKWIVPSHPVREGKKLIKMEGDDLFKEIQASARTNKWRKREERDVETVPSWIAHLHTGFVYCGPRPTFHNIDYIRHTLKVTHLINVGDLPLKDTHTLTEVLLPMTTIMSKKVEAQSSELVQVASKVPYSTSNVYYFYGKDAHGNGVESAVALVFWAKRRLKTFPPNLASWFTESQLTRLCPELREPLKTAIVQVKGSIFQFTGANPTKNL